MKRLALQRGRVRASQLAPGDIEADALDEGTLWPVAFALTKLSAADEARVGALVKKVVSRGLSSQPAP